VTVALLALSDGRHAYHAAAYESALEHLPSFDQYVFVRDPDHRLGYAGAIQYGWQQIETDYVFHLEADFTFNERVDLAGMTGLLDRQQHLAQVALKRQPWNPQEHAAGGIVELHPDDFHERTDGHATWTEHRRFWTTNPCVYRADMCALGWPQLQHSEGVFTHYLLRRDPATRFAFWGGKHAAPKVHHIGEHRAGGGY
jgi:hypothetical protein